MKVTNEHYGILKLWTVSALKAKNLTKSNWDEVYKDNTNQRKVWDLYWFTMDSSIMAKEIIRPIFDQYNDSHIETALNKLYSELTN